MSDHDILNVIKEDFSSLKSNGLNQVNIDSLIDYLDKLEEVGTKDKEVELENLRALNQSSLNVQQHNLEAYLEAFRATISAGANIVKMLMLVNGGAAVALLAFIGNIWTKSSISDYVPLLSISLKYFCYGVAGSLGCGAFTYFCQLLVSHNYLNPTRFLTRSAFASNMLAIAFGFVSIGCFFFGVKEAADLFFHRPIR